MSLFLIAINRHWILRLDNQARSGCEIEKFTFMSVMYVQQKFFLPRGLLFQSE